MATNTKRKKENINPTVKKLRGENARLQDALNNSVQEAAHLKEKYEKLHEDTINRNLLVSQSFAKQKTVKEKQDVINELVGEAIKHANKIHHSLFKFFKGSEPPPLHLQGREIRSVHEWLDDSISGLRGLNEMNHRIKILIEENL